MENQEKKQKLEARLEVVRFDNEDVIAASQPGGTKSESESRFIQFGTGVNDFTFGSFPTKQ